MNGKNSSISTIASDTIFYGVSSFLSRSITLLTLPLLARYFTVEDYGKFDLYYWIMKNL